MSNNPKQTLRYIISTYGMEVIDDQRRLKGLLMDLCGNHPREVKLLSLALAEGAVHKLLSYKTLPIEAATRLSAKFLEDSVGMSKEAALWAMETWAEACGLGELPHEFTNILQMKFVLIPAGTFMMGSPEDAPDRGDHETQHQVTISKSFYMQTTPVTQGQWQEVMGSNPSYFKGDDNLPVEQVSWSDVQDFIGRLNQREGRDKYRLPTEAEWEYACRAGTTTQFYSGDNDDDFSRAGWYSDNSGSKTRPVGKKTPNAWGLHDMHGNVWEWVKDRYWYYPSGSVADPEVSSSGSTRVFRGGSWCNYASDCSSAFRAGEDPSYRDSRLGFRLLRTVAGSDSPAIDKSASASGIVVIGRDGRFIVYDNGTVLDTKTNLMWAAKDNGRDINWANAKTYCENYRGGGYTDWRMPTQDELAGLHDASKSRPSACNTSYLIHVATELIDITGFAPWAAETRGSEAALFLFGYVGRFWFLQSNASTCRALPVRSGK